MKNQVGRLLAISVAAPLFAGCVSSEESRLAGVRDSARADLRSNSGRQSAGISRRWTSKHNVLTVRSDRGGQLIRYMRRVKKASDRQSLVRIAGPCDSACTLFLALPPKQLCLLPGASFRFHHPYGSTKRNNDIAARYMMKSYPRWVQTWLRRNGGLTSSLKEMNHQYASRFIKRCKTNRVVKTA